MNENVKEMARDLCECYVDHDATFDAEATAEKMVAKGYHKQVNGTWVEKGNWAGSIEYECTACKESTFHAINHTYCPKCGAKIEVEPDEN